MLILAFGCSEGGYEEPGFEGSKAGSAESLSGPEDLSMVNRPPHPSVTVYRDAYELVIRDDDGWEIMLNLTKRKKIPWQPDSLYSYEGHLIYRLSYYIIKSYASAIFDPRDHIFTVCAKDSAFNRGSHIYSGNVNPDRTSFRGTYHYYLKPYRMNSAGFQIVKGKFPQTNISPVSSVAIEDDPKAIVNEPKSIVPKWER